jgi:hypothetical protein
MQLYLNSMVEMMWGWGGKEKDGGVVGICNYEIR